MNSRRAKMRAIQKCAMLQKRRVIQTKLRIGLRPDRLQWRETGHLREVRSATLLCLLGRGARGGHTDVSFRRALPRSALHLGYGHGNLCPLNFTQLAEIHLYGDITLVISLCMQPIV